MARLIAITSLVDGFRRCGVAHAKGRVLHPGDRFSDRELERIAADPMLALERDVEAEEEKASDTAAIITAIGALAPADFSKSTGVPGVKPIEKVLGGDITAAGRDRAWAILSALDVAPVEGRDAATLATRIEDIGQITGAEFDAARDVIAARRAATPAETEPART